MTNPVKVRSIIFTEACPLNCRYCDLQNDTQYGCKPQMTKEEIFEIVESYNQMDDPNTTDTRILFSGGEPFLFWDWIKEIILKYGDRFQYSFNTSGYCFTEEILEFLSHYHTSFVLSVDGGEALTNYLRPVTANPYKVGYYKQLKKILPTMLYYFPQTPFRMIIHPRYIDLVYKQYLEAEKLGFKYFTFVIDFETRPEKEVRKDKKIIKWNNEHTEKLQEQFDLIVQEIVMGFKLGIQKPRVVEIDKVIDFLINNKSFNTKDLPCQVFNDRSLSTLYNEDSHHCMYVKYPNIEDAEKALNEAYEKQNHKCSHDENCPAFEYCALTCCPQICLLIRSGFFDFDTLECAQNKVVYQSALRLLALGNEFAADEKLYKRYLNKIMTYKGVDENGDLLPL